VVVCHVKHDTPLCSDTPQGIGVSFIHGDRSVDQP
jgi:hypothetical protein